MNVRISLFLLIILINSAYAQETISEEQVLLNGYVDSSGKVLLTGYATPESLSYMNFLNGIKYSFDNNTNQLYAVTDMLTSKRGDTWWLNFSLEGYYSDYSVTFYLPPGSEITNFELQPKLNYQFQVRDDALALSIHGYRLVSPWINLEYRLPVDASDQSKVPSEVSLLLIILLISGGALAFYIHRMQKRTSLPEKKESREQEKKTIPETMPETKPEIKGIRITGEMQKVIDTLSEKEKAIILLLLRNGGSATQADIRYETGIPRSSLTGMINALKRRNLIKKYEYGRTNVIELSEWFLLENERK